MIVMNCAKCGDEGTVKVIRKGQRQNEEIEFYLCSKCATNMGYKI